MHFKPAGLVNLVLSKSWLYNVVTTEYIDRKVLAKWMLWLSTCRTRSCCSYFCNKVYEKLKLGSGFDGKSKLGKFMAEVDVIRVKERMCVMWYIVVGGLN